MKIFYKHNPDDKINDMCRIILKKLSAWLSTVLRLVFYIFTPSLTKILLTLQLSTWCRQSSHLFENQCRHLLIT